MGRVCGAAASCCPSILLVPKTVCGSSRAWTLGRGGSSQASLISFIKPQGPLPAVAGAGVWIYGDAGDTWSSGL